VSAYADTSFLLSFFGQDQNSSAATSFMARATTVPEIPFTFFGALEFNNAARTLVFRGKLDAAGLGKMQARVVQCLATNILRRTLLPVGLHYEEAELLSAALVARYGVRTLDLLHVAAARVLGSRELLSFDVRQREFAVRCGLHVRPERAATTP
jgi:predicted nucleic acid-binding protein